MSRDVRHIASAILVGLLLIVAGIHPASTIHADEANPPRSPDEHEWFTKFDEAIAEAKRLDRPLVVHFHASWCAPCRRMEREVFRSPEFQNQLGTRFIGVKIDSDTHRDLVRRYNVRALPSDVFLEPNGRVISQTQGYQDTKTYLGRIARIDAEFSRNQKFQATNNGASQEPDREPGNSPDGSNTPTDSKTAGTASPDVPRQDAPQTPTNSSRPSSDQPSSDQPSSSPPSRSSSGSDRPAPRSPEKASQPLVGLDGYSPVSLFQERKWRTGKPDFQTEYQEIVYYLANEDEQKRFEADPSKFAPRLLGCDPVLLWKTDRAIPGSTRYAAYFDGELFLFVSAESRSTFKADPLRYVRTRHVLQVDQIERAKLR